MRTVVGAVSISRFLAYFLVGLLLLLVKVSPLNGGIASFEPTSFEASLGITVRLFLGFCKRGRTENVTIERTAVTMQIRRRCCVDTRSNTPITIEDMVMTLAVVTKADIVSLTSEREL